MKIYLSSNTLKKQTKILVKNWPVKASSSPIKSSEARKVLCQLYGFKDPHHFNKLIKARDLTDSEQTKKTLNENLNYFIQRMNYLSDLGQNHAFVLLKALWPEYIISKQVFLHQCDFSFFGYLNIFLPKSQRNCKIKYKFNDFPGVKDAIESLGIPHTEIELILINGRFVDFSYRMQPGDEISVYSSQNRLKSQVSDRLNQLPEGPPRFVLDIHLGSLAKYLRMAGFDTFYDNQDLGDKVLSEISERKNRILLSRDIGLLKRSNVKYGHFVQNTDGKLQLEEIVKHYGLVKYFKPFHYCTECNGVIQPVEKETLKNSPVLPERVFNVHDEFKQCSGCHRIYWKGSHFDRMTEFLSLFKKA